MAEASFSARTEARTSSRWTNPAVEQGDLRQLLLGEDAVGLVQPGQQQGDVVVAAVVAHKDAGGVFRNILQPIHGQLHAGNAQDAFGPVGDVLHHDGADGLGVPGGQQPFGPAQHAVVDDHIAKQIDKHGYGA